MLLIPKYIQTLEEANVQACWQSNLLVIDFYVVPACLLASVITRNLDLTYISQGKYISVCFVLMHLSSFAAPGINK